MGRKDKYLTHIQPNLKKITEWKNTMTERQIAQHLGVSVSCFEKYKQREPELLKALQAGNEALIDELKSALKKKAKGFYYKETKRTIRDVDGTKTQVVEEYEKYAPPDTGAIHLLLKNIDPNWKNDDDRTYELKKKQVEIAEKKADDANW